MRGSPSNRRRWLDAAIGGTDAAYLTAVRDYGRALDGRNALLKAAIRSDEELRAFEKAMLAPAQLIAATRARILPELAATLRDACARAGQAGIALASLGRAMVRDVDPTVSPFEVKENKERDDEKKTLTF